MHFAYALSCTYKYNYNSHVAPTKTYHSSLWVIISDLKSSFSIVERNSATGINATLAGLKTTQELEAGPEVSRGTGSSSTGRTWRVRWGDSDFSSCFGIHLFYDLSKLFTSLGFGFLHLKLNICTIWLLRTGRFTA